MTGQQLQHLRAARSVLSTHVLGMRCGGSLSLHERAEPGCGQALSPIGARLLLRRQPMHACSKLWGARGRAGGARGRGAARRPGRAAGDAGGRCDARRRAAGAGLARAQGGAAGRHMQLAGDRGCAAGLPPRDNLPYLNPSSYAGRHVQLAGTCGCAVGRPPAARPGAAGMARARGSTPAAACLQDARGPAEDARAVLYTVWALQLRSATGCGGEEALVDERNVMCGNRYHLCPACISTTLARHCPRSGQRPQTCCACTCGQGMNLEGG